MGWLWTFLPRVLGLPRARPAQRKEIINLLLRLEAPTGLTFPFAFRKLRTRTPFAAFLGSLLRFAAPANALFPLPLPYFHVFRPIPLEPVCGLVIVGSSLSTMFMLAGML